MRCMITDCFQLRVDVQRKECRRGEGIRCLATWEALKALKSKYKLENVGMGGIRVSDPSLIPCANSRVEEQSKVSFKTSNNSIVELSPTRPTGIVEVWAEGA